MDPRAQVLYYANIAWRRKWLVLIPFVLSLAVSWGLVSRMPKSYSTSTTILVTPQQVPQDLIRSTVTTRVEDSISSLKVQVLSRTYLEQVVREFGLVEDGGGDSSVELACRRLRRNVKMQYDRNKLTWFSIIVEDREAERAAGIANRLGELFIEQNSRLRSEEASDTLREVEGWLAEKQAQLDEKEQLIAEYKRKHPWELNESMAANLRLLETRNQQLLSYNAEIRSLEDKLTALQMQSQSLQVMDSMTDPSQVSDPALKRQLQLEGELADLLVRYTEDNPEVRRKRFEIDDHVRRYPTLSGGQPPEEGGDGERPSLGVIGVQGEIVRTQGSIELEKEKRDRTQTQIAVLTQRIDIIPTREAELQTLTRDLATITSQYNGLLGKRDNARRAEQMEASRRGEQFRVQDIAGVPSVPFRPNTRMALIYGAMVGLGLGLGVVFLLELMDQTIRSEAHFRSVLPEVRLLVSMPHMGETGER